MHQQLRLQDVFPLLVLLIRLIRLIVLPSHRILALPARNIPHYVSASRHVAFCGFALGYIYDGVEEVGFAVLAPEALSWGKDGLAWTKGQWNRGEEWGKLSKERGTYTRDDSIVACKMGFAGFAAEDFVGV